jgi:hypothetical protein
LRRAACHHKIERIVAQRREAQLSSSGRHRWLLPANKGSPNWPQPSSRARADPNML